MDVSERKEGNPTESEVRYRILFESANDAIFTVEGNVFTDCNPKTLEMFGCSRREDIIGKVPWDLSPDVQPDGRPSKEKAQELINACITGEAQRFYWKHTRMDGTPFDAEVALNCVEFDGKTVMQAIVRDITERKQVESELQIERDKLTAIFESMEDGIYIVNKDHDIQYVNPVLTSEFGSPEGKKCHEYFHGSDDPCTFCKNDDVFSGKTVRWEWTSPRNGRTYDLIDTPIKNADGSISKLEIFRDITERKRAEEALRESDARIQALLNAPSDVMILIDSAGIVLAINKTHAKLSKKGMDEIIGNCVFDLFPPVIAEFRKRKTDEVFNTGNPIHFEESQEGRIFSTNVYPVIDANRKVTAVAVYCKDITERKRGEIALKASEEKFSKLFQTSPNVLVISNLADGRIIEMNDQGIQKLGYERDEIIGKTRDEMRLIDPEDIKKLVKMIKRNGYYSGVELKVRLKDGTEKYGMFHGQLIDIGGEPFLFQTIVDLTERKEMEEERETFFEISSDLLGIGDTNDFNLIKVNRAFLEVLGYTEEEVLSKPVTKFVHPRMRGKSIPRIKDALKMGVPSLRIENQMIAADGTTKWVAWTINLDREKELFYAAGRDITKRKESEQELRKRLMRYRLDEGSTYLVPEKVANRSLEAIRDLVNVGLSVTVFSRTPEKAFRRSIEGDYHFYWLASRDSDEAMSPDVGEIERTIEELPQKEAVLIDGIGYITSKNGFDRTLEFVQDIRELAYINDLIVVMTGNPVALDESQIRLLEMECEELVPLHETMLSEDLMELLRLIVQQHDMNVSPTYMTIVKELEISRPTARKRMTQLSSLGYITETRRGKTKTFALTEKGKNLFSK